MLFDFFVNSDSNSVLFGTYCFDDCLRILTVNRVLLEKLNHSVSIVPHTDFNNQIGRSETSADSPSADPCN